MSTKNKVAIAAFFAGFTGVLFETLPLLEIEWGHGTKIALRYLQYLSPAMGLSWFDSDVGVENEFNANYVDLAVSLLILSGSLLYIFRQGRERRLLRLGFSVVLFSKVLSLLSILIFLIDIILFRTSLQVVSLLNAVAYGNIILWTPLSWYILAKLNKENVPLTDHNTRDFRYTSKLQRAFHQVVDIIFLLLTIMILSQQETVYKFFNIIEKQTGAYMVLYTLVFIGTLLYYPFLEGIYGATPGKFLTGSLVLHQNGQKIGFKQAFLRSLCRRIPFDAFSYLRKQDGWHDQLAGTMVVKEKDPGLSYRPYIWTLLFLTVIVLSGYLGIEQYNSYMEDVRAQRREARELQNMNWQVDHLNHNDIIEMEDGGQSGYILIDSLTNQKVYGSLLRPGEELYLYAFQVQKAFRNHNKTPRNESGLRKVDFPRKRLKKAVARKDKITIENTSASNSNFLEGSPHIEQIYALHGPVLVERGMYGQNLISGEKGGPLLTFEMQNSGQPATLVSIDFIKGGFELEKDIPRRISGNGDRFILSTRDYTSGFYAFILTLEDKKGQRHYYKIEGNGLNRQIREVSKEALPEKAG